MSPCKIQSSHPGAFSEDGNTIACVAELSEDDGSTWEKDLELTYRRDQSSSPAA